MPRNSLFATTYLHKQTVNPQCITLSWSKFTKVSDDSNNVHFSGVRFLCSPFLAIKSVLALLESIMTRCGTQMNLRSSK